MHSKRQRAPALPAPGRAPAARRRPHSAIRIAAIGPLGAGLYASGPAAGADAQVSSTAVVPDATAVATPTPTPEPSPVATPTPEPSPVATPTPEPPPVATPTPKPTTVATRT